MTHRIGVIGSGSWGTALAVHLAHSGHDVRLWARDPVLASSMSASRENPGYLPGIALPPMLLPTHDMAIALEGAQFVVIAVPSHGVRDVATLVNAHLPRSCAIVSATKGLEEGSMLRMSQVLRQELPDAGEIVVLSGPSFASELARKLPTALVAAGESSAVVESVMAHFRSPALRLYGSSDVVGVELGGSLKNIIAIAAGVVEGLGLGHNAKAALITRGLAELSRLAVALGAERDTLAGLAGLGDLVLTCTGDLSRNRRLGLALANGQSLEQFIAGTKMVAEGVRTTHAALALSAKHHIELPIAQEMSDVLGSRTDPKTAIRNLMGRKQKLEHA
ncbi:MAG TPA: NAD(P)H-dependent glycerol-3-phosphate dehydrogenase [Vicinamibacterales bacterium]|nr:NAD(P)H-dependent glycerol-3-phosphate dehydrogenase [Vicinamibacterales bacterium]